MENNTYYDRYAPFRRGGDVDLYPSITIPVSSDDVFITYDRNTHRFDSLSYKYYNDANYAWLILLANPSLGSLEFKIRNGVTLRIPYPLTSAINRYEVEVNKYLNTQNS